MQQYDSLLCMATFRCEVTGVLHVSLLPIVSELCSVMPLATMSLRGPANGAPLLYVSAHSPSKRWQCGL